ncbi:MAG: patatin-like phospholipase family protein [Candidatus Thermoplasmatota archaeon]|nr:patatin-like phospholipase family protein [Candidatus Thermoplasmatota archaeon]
MKGSLKVLSIDGGGIRGIIPSMVLKDIEEITGDRISDLFDLIGGTSTGGVIALGLTKPNSKGKPEFSAKDILDLYERNGSRIFYRSIWRTLESAWALLDEKYSVKGFEDVMEEYFGDTRLKEALSPLIIPSYEIESRSAWFFRSERARVSPDYDFPMKEVARATSAAPTYFEPARLRTENGVDYYALIDGGTYANNPALCTYVEARTLFPEATDILVLSLGTGELTRRISLEDAKGWGLANWAHPILNVMFDGQSDTVDYQMEKLLQHSGARKRYFRFQTRLDSGMDDLDNASEQNMHNLKVEAQEMIDKHSEDLDLLCDMLRGD